jgi:predicted aspartyl protease
MIYGKVIDARAIVPVVFRLPSQPDFSLDFVIDTGFNDHLTLPPQAVSAMNLPLYSNTVQLRRIVGWVKRSATQQKRSRCWVSFLNPTYV